MTTSEQVAVQVSSSTQTSPQVESSPARLRANSGKQDGRDFNKRGGELGRQPISFRSCVEDSEHTDQKAAQVASAPPGSDVKNEGHGGQAEGGQKRSKVDQTQMRMVQSQDDFATAKRGGRQYAERSQRQPMPWRRQVCGGSELCRRSPRRQRRHAVQPNEQSD